MNTNNSRSEVDDNVIDLIPMLERAETQEEKQPMPLSMQAALHEAIASGTLHLLDLENVA